MGEFLDAIKQEQAVSSKSPLEAKLKAHLGDKGWKDFEAACLDDSISTSVIHRVITARGFKIGHNTIAKSRRQIRGQ